MLFNKLFLSYLYIISVHPHLKRAIIFLYCVTYVDIIACLVLALTKCLY